MRKLNTKFSVILAGVLTAGNQILGQPKLAVKFMEQC